MSAVSFGDRWEDAAQVFPSPDPFDLVTHGVSIPAELLEPFPDSWPAWVPVAYEGALFGGVTRWPQHGPGRYYRLPGNVWQRFEAAFSRRPSTMSPRAFVGQFFSVLRDAGSLDTVDFLESGALTHAVESAATIFPD